MAARKKQADELVFKTSVDPGSNAFTNGANTPVVITTPAVPATTVTATNSNECAVAVTVTGATVTAVTVAGTQVGSGAGTYTVLPGQTIALTYASGTPTWAWAFLGFTDPGSHTFTNGAATPGD